MFAFLRDVRFLVFIHLSPASTYQLARTLALVCDEPIEGSFAIYPIILFSSSRTVTTLVC